MRSRTVGLICYWIVAAAAVTLLTLWAANLARASMADCIDATCRISTPDGGRGTGCVFEVDGGRVYVLTCAHVVEGVSTVELEFWRAGHQSRKIAATVAARSTGADAAIVTVAEAAFAGAPPAAVPMAPREYVVTAGQTLVSVGCANGTWSTAWKGHALRQQGSDLLFRPTPANGRSGSAIFDAEGTRIVGLLRARNEQDRHGIATSIEGLYRGLGTPTAYAGRQVQCPGGVCPTPQGGAQATPEDSPWRLLPYRQKQDQQFRGIQQQQSNPVYPTLPMQPIGPAAPAVDLGPTNQRLDGLGDKIDLLVEEIRRSHEAAPPIPVAPLPSEPLVDEAALKAAEEAKAEAAAVKEGTEKALGEVQEESSKVRELIATLIGDRETLSERIEARLAKVKEELGEDAGKQDVAKAYVKDLLAEKLQERATGITTGKILGGALGLSAPMAFGIGLGLFFIARRIGSKVADGEPLLVQRLLERIEDRIESLRARRNESDAAAVDPPSAKGRKS
ncbi:MAG TPA: serine protease [Phycisphaerae bacterium]|nr:serine protease [Phycisphaerae bacterium]